MRLRRRRQAVLAVVVAAGVLVPAVGLLSSVGAGSPGVQMSVAGRVPAGSTPPPAAPGSAATAGVESPTTSMPLLTATTVAVHQRLSSVDGTPVTGGAPLLPVADSVVRSATPGPTTGPAAKDVSTTVPAITPTTQAVTTVSTAPGEAGAPPAGGKVVAAASAGTAVAPSGVALQPCPVDEVAVTVSTDLPAYGPGDRVTGWTSVANRSSGACVLPTGATVEIRDASGTLVSTSTHTLEGGEPVPAKPGRTLTAGFSWDQQDCSGAACGAGPYSAVATWSPVGTARVTFTIGP